MLGKKLRPWGQLEWVLSKAPNKGWDFIGCLAPEDRCMEAFELVASNGYLKSSNMFKISDPPSRYTTEIESKVSKKVAEFLVLGGHLSDIYDFTLFDNHHLIVTAVSEIVAKSNGHIILDISSLPKRFFFPVVKLLLIEPNIKSLIATYTMPVSHANDSMAEDHQPAKPLPLFGPTVFPDIKPDLAIIGVGFLPLGLRDLLEAFWDNTALRFLFPFPPGPTSFFRTWDLMRRLEINLPNDAKNTPIYVDAVDTSDTFDHLLALSDNGSLKVNFAPYGPKTMSLAVAIYASLTNSPVYYTQPSVYNPNYCIGVKQVNGVSQVYGHCIRVNSHNYYSIPG